MSAGDTTARNGKRAQKRLTINLPIGVFEELQELSDHADQPMNMLIRNALALAKLYYDERDKGNRLVVVDKDDFVKEILIPR